MINICFVTATRAEYGLMKWLIKDMKQSRDFNVRLIVTGTHLMPKYGNTVNEIIEDGLVDFETLEADLKDGTKDDIAEYMGELAIKIPKVLNRNLPDALVVLGDRYELLPVCNAAYTKEIPIVHLCGGDVTKGAIDDGIRNAVTQMASYHFPGTKESGANIIRMRNSSDNVWIVGETALDAYNRETLLTREELSESLNMDVKNKWVLFTCHPETTKTRDYSIAMVKNTVQVLLEFQNYEIMATYSNADYGGEEINRYLESVKEEYPERFHVVPSLGRIRYLSFMKNAEFVIGNSSSGIVEATSLGIWSINIGMRQMGRHLCNNVLQCDEIDMESIRKAILRTFDGRPDSGDKDYWGDGHSSQRICDILKEVLL